jgi:hypothetical protein
MLYVGLQIISFIFKSENLVIVGSAEINVVYIIKKLVKLFPNEH